jgi:prevent-host-death family protein
MRYIVLDEKDRKLAQLLDQTEEGERIIFVRHGRPVAQLTALTIWPTEAKQTPAFPDLHEFRASIAAQGESLSDVVLREREEQRY